MFGDQVLRLRLAPHRYHHVFLVDGARVEITAPLSLELREVDLHFPRRDRDRPLSYIDVSPQSFAEAAQQTVNRWAERVIRTDLETTLARIRREMDIDRQRWRAHFGLLAEIEEG